jgi:superfamily II helicase
MTQRQRRRRYRAFTCARLEAIIVGAALAAGWKYCFIVHPK